MIENSEKNKNINRENDRNIEPEESKFSNQKSQDNKDEMTIEEKLKDSEDKLLRSLAEIENQRKRFEKKDSLH